MLGIGDFCSSCFEQEAKHEVIANSFYLATTLYCCECFGQCYEESH